MKIKNIKGILLAFSLFAGLSYAQNDHPITPQLLNRLTEVHQKCLDQGDNMWNCSNVYYYQMDSLLNIVYKNIKSNTPPDAFEILKKDQLKWLSNRDKVYSDTNKESKEEGLDATDASMVALDREADFVKERILFLLKHYGH